MALVEAVTKDATWSDAALLAASGFRDMSRLAGGNPEMYHDICITNNKAIVSWLDTYIAALQGIRNAIYTQDEHLSDIFADAQRERLQWSTSQDSLEIKNSRQNILDK